MGAPNIRSLIKGVVAVRVKARIIGVLSAVALAVGGAVGIAAPAFAADYSLDCTTTGQSAVNVSAGKFLGTTYTILNSGANTCAVNTSGTAGVLTWTSSNGVDTPSSDPVFLSAGATLTVTMATTGSETIIISRSPGRTYNYAFTVTSGGGGGGGGSSSVRSTVSAPADVMQQVGVPADGKCSSIVDATLNWAGVSSGGWGTSWAQWMNGGKGGAVCNRALFYDLGLSKWGVRA